MRVTILLETIFVMVSLMLVGYIGAKKGLFTREFLKALSTLVFNVFLSCSVFGSICGDVPEMSLASILGIIGICALTIVISYFLSTLVATLIYKDKPVGPAMEISIATMNTLLFGLPIVQEVYGPAAVLYMGLSSVGFNLILFTYGTWRLGRNGEREGHRFRLKDILSPVLVATVLAFVFLIARFPIPSVVRRFLSATSGVTMPLSMIVLGVTMGAGNLIDAFRDKRVYAAAFFRLIVCPMLVFLVLNPICTDPILLRTCVVIAGCPVGAIVPVLALQYHEDALFASRCVMVTTLMSVITLPAIILLLG